MPEAIDEFVEGLKAKAEIESALLTYCRGVDRRDFDLVRSVYHPDAVDFHGPYNGDVDGLLDWMRIRHETVAQSMHFLGNTIIELDGKFADVETYCITFQKIESGTAGSTANVGLTVGSDGQQTQVRCRYLDRFELRDGRWKILKRTVAYESLLLEDSESETPFASGMQLATRDGSDPLYTAFG